MAVTRIKKEEILQALTEKFGKAKAVYFAKNKGLEVKKLAEFRKKLFNEGLEMVVAKKTLMRLAAKKNNLPELPTELMEGPISITFGYEDVLSPARLLYEFSKNNENLELLGGVMENRIVSKVEAKQLATLPPRDQLLAKLVGSIKSPLYGFHEALSGVLRKFVYALQAVHDKKGAPS